MNNLLCELSTDNDTIESEQKEIEVKDLLNTKISYKSKVMDIEAVLNGLKRGDYKLPNYQRKYVWEKGDASNLILSLIKNIPIPPIYLYYDNKTGAYVILDGQQRITTLFMYYKGIFYKNKDRKRIDFKDVSLMLERVEEMQRRLNEHNDLLLKEDVDDTKRKIEEIYSEMEEKYNLKLSDFKIDTQDITFKNFDEKAKRVLIRKDIEAVFVSCDSDEPHKAYTEIFKLLNSAGKELSNQEIRNGVYSDNILYRYIDKINENNEIWRKLYGNSLISKDFEYLLRFLALDFFTEYDEKNNNIKLTSNKTFSLAGIIDNYSDMFNDKNINSEIYSQGNIQLPSESDEAARKEVKKLEKFFTKFRSILDNDDKIPGGKILILEAIFIAFSKLGLLDKEIDIDYFRFINSLDLKTSLGVTTSASNKGNVEKRIKNAIEIVKEQYKC